MHWHTDDADLVGRVGPLGRGGEHVVEQLEKVVEVPDLANLARRVG